LAVYLLYAAAALAYTHFTESEETKSPVYSSDENLEMFVVDGTWRRRTMRGV
jgi:hypothetical protein